MCRVPYLLNHSACLWQREGEERMKEDGIVQLGSR